MDKQKMDNGDWRERVAKRLNWTKKWISEIDKSVDNFYFPGECFLLVEPCCQAAGRAAKQGSLKFISAAAPQVTRLPCNAASAFHVQGVLIQKQIRYIDIYILLGYLESKLHYCWPINICLQLFSFVSSRSYWAKLLTSRPLLLVSSALLRLPKKILDRNIFHLDNFELYSEQLLNLLQGQFLRIACFWSRSISVILMKGWRSVTKT